MTTKEQELHNTAERLTKIFGRSAGLHLGITDKRGTITSPTLFGLVQNKTLALLHRGWTETELKDRIATAHKEYHTVKWIDDLVVGQIPTLVRKQWDRNLLENPPRRYHPVLQQTPRRMPVLRAIQTPNGIVGEVVQGSARPVLKESFTTRDLNTYWQERTSTLPHQIQVSWSPDLWAVLLDRHDVSDILWAIDSLVYDATEIPSSHYIKIWDIEPYIVLEIQQSNDTAVMFGQKI